MRDDTDPFWTTWLDVCSRRRSNGFSSLSPVEQTFFAMNFFTGTVQTGGFHPYFDMASREEIEIAKAGFRANGAPELAALLQKAQEVLFPSGVPEQFQDQLDALPSWSEDDLANDVDPPWSVAIQELNQAFYSQSSRAYSVVQRFFTEHLADSRE